MGLVYTWFDHTQGKRPLEIVFSSRIRVKWNTGRRGIEQTELEMTVNRREIQYFYGPNIESVTALTGEVQFAPHGGHWCVCQRPPGGAQRPPSLRYFDRLNNNNVMLRCPLHNSVG